MYDITYFYGFFVAMLTYWACYAAFPVPKQTGSSSFVLAEHMRMLEAEESKSEAAEPMAVQPAKLEV